MQSWGWVVYYKQYSGTWARVNHIHIIYINIIIISWNTHVYRWRELKQNFDLKQQESQLLEDKLRQSTHGQQLEEINELQQSIGMPFTIHASC